MLDDFSVPGFSLRTNLSFTFITEDASGESSSTASASKGTKAKKLSCKVCIKYDHALDLKNLIEKAQATENGEGVIYTITNRTANGAGMRQAFFTSDFRVDEQDGLHCWQISFTLAEYVSVPERTEQRTQKTEVGTVAGNSGDSVTASNKLDSTTSEMMANAEAQVKAASEAMR